MNSREGTFPRLCSCVFEVPLVAPPISLIDLHTIPRRESTSTNYACLNESTKGERTLRRVRHACWMRLGSGARLQSSHLPTPTERLTVPGAGKLGLGALFIAAHIKAGGRLEFVNLMKVIDLQQLESCA